jgi:1,4-alpha-glucan branching enzyme
MIKTTTQKADGSVKVTFALHDDRNVSVVGDFNDWDATAHPLRRRSNGTRSASVVVPEGAELRFRYVTDSGEWFDEEGVALEPNDQGSANGVLRAA